MSHDALGHAVLRTLFDGWQAVGDGALELTVEGDNGVMTVLGDAAPVHGVLLEAFAPIEVPPEKLHWTDELVARINDRLLYAAFMLDHDRGAVSCRTALELEPIADRADAVELGAALFASRAATAVDALDRYLPAFLVVVHGDTLPAEALEVVESWGRGGD